MAAATVTYESGWANEPADRGRRAGFQGDAIEGVVARRIAHRLRVSASGHRQNGKDGKVPPIERAHDPWTGCCIFGNRRPGR